LLLKEVLKVCFSNDSSWLNILFKVFKKSSVVISVFVAEKIVVVRILGNKMSFIKHLKSKKLMI
jgi:hypothetical protein